jgi:hypothetical protein
VRSTEEALLRAYLTGDARTDDVTEALLPSALSGGRGNNLLLILAVLGSLILAGCAVWAMTVRIPDGVGLAFLETGKLPGD